MKAPPSTTVDVRGPFRPNAYWSRAHALSGRNLEEPVDRDPVAQCIDDVEVAVVLEVLPDEGRNHGDLDADVLEGWGCTDPRELHDLRCVDLRLLP